MLGSNWKLFSVEVLIENYSRWMFLLNYIIHLFHLIFTCLDIILNVFLKHNLNRFLKNKFSISFYYSIFPFGEVIFSFYIVIWHRLISSSLPSAMLSCLCFLVSCMKTSCHGVLLVTLEFIYMVLFVWFYEFVWNAWGMTAFT